MFPTGCPQVPGQVRTLETFEKYVKKLNLPKEIYSYPYYITNRYSDPKKEPEEIIHLLFQQDIEMGVLEESKITRNLRGNFISRRRVLSPEDYFFSKSEMEQKAKKYSGRFKDLEEAI